MKLKLTAKNVAMAAILSTGLYQTATNQEGVLQSFTDHEFDMKEKITCVLPHVAYGVVKSGLVETRETLGSIPGIKMLADQIPLNRNWNAQIKEQTGYDILNCVEELSRDKKYEK